MRKRLLVIASTCATLLVSSSMAGRGRAVDITAVFDHQ